MEVSDSLSSELGTLPSLELSPQANCARLRMRSRPGVALRFVCQGAHNRPEDHGGSKAGNEEPPNIPSVKAIVLIQRIDIRTLEPVPSCQR